MRRMLYVFYWLLVAPLVLLIAWFASVLLTAPLFSGAQLLLGDARLPAIDS